MKKSSEKKTYTAIGLMSGTAMDGIDAAAIETDGYSYIKPLGFVSEAHDPFLRNLLQGCLNKTKLTKEIKDIEQAFTCAQIPVIQKLIKRINKSNQNIDFIGFHGQTIHHDPSNGVTIQLGDGELLAAEIGITVINDFRSNDMSHGGQGAPLLPVYHQALVKNAGLDLPIVILNLGGVANITWISDGDMVAFDTGPANAMIDDWVKNHTDKNYDEGGKIASTGVIDQAIINQFLSLSYFLKKYPKSLDRNDFNDIDYLNLSLEDGAATLTDMTVQSVALGINQCPSKPHAIYVTGGGRHNKFMMQRLSEVTQIKVHLVDELGWNGDAMEAEGFAYMAVRSHLHEPISFPCTTGCQDKVTGGVMHNPQKDVA
jgi:anhydro-N-acetylmuramic acid kinase